MKVITPIVEAVKSITESTRYGLRAPRGGCTVNGRTFKGGQFCLPYDPADPHGVETAPCTAPAVKPGPLKLTVNGFNYIVSAIDAGECGTAAFSMLKTSSNNHYDVVLNHFGELTCDCPDYVCRHENKGTVCKHGQALLAASLIVLPAQPEPESQFDGKALYSWAYSKRNVGTVSATARQLGHSGYLRMLGPVAAREVYDAVVEMQTATTACN